MAWIILIISGAFEAVWATALGRSENFTKLRPSIIFTIALIVSMIGLAKAMRTIPAGTAYAVWVGIGACLTMLYAMATGAETASLLKAGCLLMIITGIIGLKYLQN